MSRSSGRTKPCSRADAQGRFRRAEAFLYVADLVLGEEVGSDQDYDDINLSGVSAALAVLAGIAAADAVCCHRLAAHSRGRDHQRAVALVRTVIPNGPAMANDLDRRPSRRPPLAIRHKAGVAGRADARSWRSA